MFREDRTTLSESVAIVFYRAAAYPSSQNRARRLAGRAIFTNNGRITVAE
jgi:hypothetical protein